MFFEKGLKDLAGPSKDLEGPAFLMKGVKSCLSLGKRVFKCTKARLF